MKMTYISDWGLATTIHALGFQLVKISWENPQRAKFCFEQTERLNALVQCYWQRQLRIEPQAFLIAQKLLKSRLYSEK